MIKKNYQTKYKPFAINQKLEVQKNEKKMKITVIMVLIL